MKNNNEKRTSEISSKLFSIIEILISESSKINKERINLNEWFDYKDSIKAQLTLIGENPNLSQN